MDQLRRPGEADVGMGHARPAHTEFVRRSAGHFTRRGDAVRLRHCQPPHVRRGANELCRLRFAAG